MALALAAVPDADGRPTLHDWRDGRPARRAGRAPRRPLLLRPVTVDQISDWAHARQRMPPKSTYFYPKPRTGMVFRPVED